MRAFTIVLLVAASAVAAPSYQTIYQDGINNMILPNRGANSNAASIALTLVDPSDTTPYVLTLEQTLLEMMSLSDSHGQSLATLQILALLGTLVNGYPGDSCAASIAINDYAAGGTAASYRSVLAKFVDFLVQVYKNPDSRRFASGPSGGCVGDGTINQMDVAWDRILDNASKHSYGILNEEYCSIKSLYNANFIRSNNVAAACTAAAAVAEEGCDYHTILNFFYALAYQGDVDGTADACKRALMS